MGVLYRWMAQGLRWMEMRQDCLEEERKDHSLLLPVASQNICNLSVHRDPLLGGKQEDTYAVFVFLESGSSTESGYVCDQGQDSSVTGQGQSAGG